MTRDEAKEAIRQASDELLDKFLVRAKTVSGKPTWVCPSCGNGSGRDGDGIILIPNSEKVLYKCFVCGWSGDVMQAYMDHAGTDFNEALQDLAGMLGITIDQGRPPATWTAPGQSTATTGGGQAPQVTATQAPGQGASDTTGSGQAPQVAAAEQAAPVAPPAPDHRAYYQACVARLQDPVAFSYLRGRGISIETAQAGYVGFDPAADPAGKGYPAPRIIIPTSGSQYIGRAVDPGNRYRIVNSTGGSVGLFNGHLMQTKAPGTVFVVEGAFDALSVMEAGGQAVALNSTAQVGFFLQQLDEAARRGLGTRITYILSLDNDPAGQAAMESLRQGLAQRGRPHVAWNISGAHKDPNEALTADRGGFIGAVNEALRACRAPDNITDYIKYYMQGDMARCRQEISTGLPSLDAKAGGLYAGLYVLAAISSLGKTTLASQLADQIAAAGNHVLFFSLEMSRLEMAAKSITRETARAALDAGGQATVTALAVRRGPWPPEVAQAAQRYGQAMGGRLSVIEGNFNADATYICNYVRQYSQSNAVLPVVFIDYLQILPPPAEAARATTKEQVDMTVTALKRLSRELGITIVVIASLNRANYMTPFGFESLKESGGIEYTADVVWGLQLHCLQEELFTKDSKGNTIAERRARISEAKAECPREIDLVCVKNRYGIASYTIPFEYYPTCDLFREAEPLGIPEEWA